MMNVRVSLSVLSLVLSLTLVSACGSGDSSSTPGTPESGVGSSASGDTASTTRTDEPTSGPSETSGTPGATPGDSSATPGETSGTPGDTSGTPGDTSATPGETSATTTLPAPQNLSATDGTRSDAVALSWDAVDGAEGYHVYVDDTRITEQAILETTWLDTDAEAGSGPPEIALLEAGDDRSDGVLLTWQAPEGTPGASRTYRIRAVAGEEESELSAPAEGRRGAEAVTDYEVLVDGTWTALGAAVTFDGDSASWLDTDAPLRTLAIPRPEATTEDPERITVTVGAATVQEGDARTYTLRALTASGAGESSDAVTGNRVAGPRTYAWEWAPLGDDTWTAIDAVNGSPRQVVDEDVAVGESRRYRVTASAEGATPLTSAIATGTRFAPGAPENVRADQGVGSTVTVTWDAVEDAIGYHVYRDGVRLTETPVGASSTPEWVDETPLPPPAPPAVTTLRASDDRSDGVRLTWDPVTPADAEAADYQVQTLFDSSQSGLSTSAAGWAAALPVTAYQILRDDEVLTTLLAPGDPEAERSFLDADAPLVRIQSVTASASSNLFNGIQLEASFTFDSLPEASYLVVAESAAGTGLVGTPTIGNRSAGTIEYAWQWQPISGGEWSDIGPDSAAFLDETPEPGEERLYRVELSGEGVHPATSAEIPGRRLAPVPLAAPETVTASQGTSTEAVELSWSDVEGAETWSVWRVEGETLHLLAEGLSERTWSDTTAPAGGVPGAPVLSVALPASPEGVDLVWTTPSAPAGTAVTYVVQAFSSDATTAPGERSEPVTGFRGALPIDSYDVIACRPTCVTIADEITEAAWRDTDAPLGSISLSMPSASTNRYDGVFVAIDEAESSAPAETLYRVVARNAAGPGDTSNDASGARGLGVVSWQWEFSDPDADSFSAWTEATQRQRLDVDIAPGASRDYRVRASAAGAESALSSVVRGTRLELGVPEDLSASSDVSAHVRLEWSAVPDATAYRVYRNDVWVGTAQASGGAMESWQDSGAPAPPAPPVPQNFAAEGTPGGIVFTWDAVTTEDGAIATYRVRSTRGGAESERSEAVEGRRAAAPAVYDVRAQSGFIAEGLETTTYLHEGVPLRQLTLSSPEASTDQIAGVELTIAASTVQSGGQPLYIMRARNTTGASNYTDPVQALREAGERTYRWESRAPGDSAWSDTGLVGREVVDTSLERGESREYRVEVSAPGAETAFSSVVTGTRLDFVALGDPCTATSDCVANAWCPTETLPELRRCAPAPSLDKLSGEMLFQYIPPGDMLRGSHPLEPGRSTDERQRIAIITHATFMQRAPVTQAQWAEIIEEADETWGVTPSFREDCDDCPVDSINFYEAALFANLLSIREGLEPCYTLNGCGGGSVGAGCPALQPARPRRAICETGTWTCDEASFAGVTCTGYRLPTEAEWEYAARAGTTEMTWAGDFLVGSCEESLPVLGDIAWYTCSDFPGGTNQTQPVEGLTGNPWGLFDLFGNVAEWTVDTYFSTFGNAVDPVRQGDENRVTRGSSVFIGAAAARAANRSNRAPGVRTRAVGFRLARTLPAPEGVSCPELEQPDSSGMTVSGTGFGDSAAYFCFQPDPDNPRMRTGPSLRACLATGEWSGTQSECVPLDCGTPRQPAYGSATLDGSGSAYLDTATFRCDTGYSLGEAETGFSINPDTTETLRCIPDIDWPGATRWATLDDESDFTGCFPMDCGELHAPENGDVTYSSTALGAVATYSCEAGWELGGVEERVCTPQGWTGTRPNCACTSTSQCASGQICNTSASAEVRQCARSIPLPTVFERAMNFVHMPPGSFRTSSVLNPSLLWDVVLTRAYEVLDTEVLQAHWREFATGLGYAWTSNPSFWDGSILNRPVESINLPSAFAFANALSAREGLQQCYLLTGCTGEVGFCARFSDFECLNPNQMQPRPARDPFSCAAVTVVNPNTCTGYRLPTHAEWEYAARGGTTTNTWNGDIPSSFNSVCDVDLPLLSSIANYCFTARNPDAPPVWLGTQASAGIGGLPANPWGVRSALGNVEEMIGESLGRREGVDPNSGFTILDTSTSYVRRFRGGSWESTPFGLRVENVTSNTNPFTGFGARTGFRLVRTLPLDPGVTCNFPPLPENGGVDLSGGPATYGDEAQYFCAEGFTLSQNLPVVCASNGEWVGFPPTCDP